MIYLMFAVSCAFFVFLVRLLIRVLATRSACEHLKFQNLLLCLLVFTGSASILRLTLI